MQKTRLRVGLSGWSYRHWKDDFYAGVPQRRWLDHAAEVFDVMEVNATFYRFMAETTYAKWRDQTPADFAFILKGHRSVTHNKKLKDTGELKAIRAMRDGAAPLIEAGKLAAVLWQLPPGLAKHTDRLRAFAEALARDWPGTPHALEFRHASWFDDETLGLLQDHGLAPVTSDAGDFPRWDATTGPIAYARLHGAPRTYHDGYDEAALRAWAAWASGQRKAGRDVYITFDNDAEGHAPHDGQRLKEIAGQG